MINQEITSVITTLQRTLKRNDSATETAATLFACAAAINREANQWADAAEDELLAEQEEF